MTPTQQVSMLPAQQFTPPPGMTVFVGGFLFYKDHVALVRKAKPLWQLGKLNAIGGAVEPMESRRAAMRREFEEETKLITLESDWESKLVLIASDGSWCVDFFACVWHEAAKLEGTKTEPVGWYKYNPMRQDVIHNLHWIIPFMRDPDIKTPIYVLDKRGMDYGKREGE